MPKTLLVSLFFLLTPLMLVLSLTILLERNHQTAFLGNGLFTPKEQVAYAALPPSQEVLGTSVAMNDKRIISLGEFLATYHSPLAPYASLFVSKADEYNIDYRLLVAIAMQETTLCKKALPTAPYNCWGWGIYGKRVTNFASYEDAIDTISRYFANRKERGIESLDEIGTIYNPGNTNHWKENVADFMSQIAQI